MPDINDYAPESGRMLDEDNEVVNIADIADGVAKTDTDGNYYVGEIDVLHDVIHQGGIHAMSYTKLDVAVGGTLKVLFIASADKDIHLRPNYGGDLKTRLKSFVAPTYTGGTEYVPFNRQTALPNSLECTLLVDPTVTDNGTLRGDEFVGTAGNVQTRAGGDSTNDLETVVNAGTVLLLEITNAGEAVADLEFTGAIYERSKFIE